MGLNLQTVGEAWILTILFGVIYFLLEVLGFPKLAVAYPIQSTIVTEDITYVYRAVEPHHIMILIFGFWLSMYISLLILHKIKEKKQ